MSTDTKLVTDILEAADLLPTGDYTALVNVTAYEQAAIFGCAKGCYQHNLLRGNEAWSGATLKGTAKSYGRWYRRSRENLLGRVRRIDSVAVIEARLAHGKRVVILLGSAA